MGGRVERVFCTAHAEDPELGTRPPCWFAYTATVLEGSTAQALDPMPGWAETDVGPAFQEPLEKADTLSRCKLPTAVRGVKQRRGGPETLVRRGSGNLGQRP